MLGLAGSLLVLAMVAVLVARRSSEPTVTATSSTTTQPSAGTRPTTGSSRTTGITAATTSVVPPPATTATTGPGATAAPRTPAVIWQGDPTGRVVALTFDAGADAGHAVRILDALGANGIRATFGITGRFAEQFPQVVARVAADGHQIVNHSYDHPSFTGVSTGEPPLSADQRTAQLERAEAAIRAATGAGSSGWFRPPYGDIDDSVAGDAAAAGWPTLLMWTVDSLGWKGIGADAVVARCLARAEPGAIYLFHVGQAADDADALQRIIDGLRAEGYGFVTVAEMLG